MRSEISAARWVDRSQLATLRLSGVITPWFEMILERVRWAR
jgi:isopentenyldiphosphate isomerase